MIIIDLEERGAPVWLLAAGSVLPLLTLILLGEVGPKMLGYVMQERWAAIAAAPMAAVEKIFSPILTVLEASLISPLTRLFAPQRKVASDITADELAALLDLSAKRGLIGHDANELLQEIMSLTDIRIGDIMVPRVDMTAYDIDHPRGGLIELFRKTRLRKIPVFEHDPDHIIGAIDGKELILRPQTPMRELTVRLPFVPEAAKVERVLLQLRVMRKQMAIVVDEYGGTAGLVTLEDILEEIVGDIPDPNEPQPSEAVSRISEREYILDGNLSIHEWADAFKIDLVNKRLSTIGGFVTSLLGRIPRVDDSVTYRNLHFTVVSMRGRRVHRLRLRLLEVEA